MKKEPLKNKVVKEYTDGAKYEVVKIIFNEPHIKLSNVKSAVEWLKEWEIQIKDSIC